MRQLKHHEQKVRIQGIHQHSMECPGSPDACSHHSCLACLQLLKKVDFLRWKSTDNIRELQVQSAGRMNHAGGMWQHRTTTQPLFSCCPAQVMRRYHIQERDDYKKYNKICGMVTKLTTVLKQLDPLDPLRIELTDQLLEKWVQACSCSCVPQ